MDKEDVVHIHSGILFSHKKKTNPTICNNMDGTRGYYAQWNKLGGERQVPNDLTHLWSIRTKKKTEGTKQQQTHRTQEWTNSYQGKGTGKGRWEGREKGNKRLAHNIGGAQGRQYSTEKTSSDSIASYFADGQRLLWGMWWQLDNGVILVTTMLSMWFYSNDTKMKNKKIKNKK